MNLLRRLRRATPPTVPACDRANEELRAFQTVIEAAIAAVGSQGESARTELLSQLVAVRTSFKEDVARERALLSERLDGLEREISKVGREQFHQASLLEGQGRALDDLIENWHANCRQQERTLNALGQAIAGLGEDLTRHARLTLVQDLLPVADALAESIRAARELGNALLAEAPDQRSTRAHPGTWHDRLVAAAVAAVRARLTRAGLLVPKPPLPKGALPAPFSPLDQEGSMTLASSRNTGAVEAWLTGLELVERRLLAVLEGEGVHPIDAVGKPYDPYRHQAVATVSDDDVPDNTIVAEERRGYTIGERILRPAEVVVARRDSHREGDESEEDRRD